MADSQAFAIFNNVFYLSQRNIIFENFKNKIEYSASTRIMKCCECFFVDF